MFTGLVEGIGNVVRLVLRSGEARLRVEAPFWTDMQPGESIAVNGVCLTVTGTAGGRCDFDVSRETVDRTNLGSLQPGDPVNLERALRLSDRLGGHLVTGHVDAVGKILLKRPSVSSVQFRVAVPDSLAPYLVPKGSVAVDGISLTVNSCTREFFEINVIPHTLQRTTLRYRNPGDPVNIETDLIGKYVERMLRTVLSNESGDEGSGLSLDTLGRHGFL